MHTCWVGTKFVEDIHDTASWLASIAEHDGVRYVCGQRELCPTSFKHHVQFMVQFTRTRQLSYARRHIDDKTHWEPMRGSAKQARDYCTKEDTRFDGPWEFGKMGLKGKPPSFDDAVDAIASGVPPHQVAAEQPHVWAKHGRGLLELRKILNLEQDRRDFGDEGPELWVLHGPSGTGKSRYVQEHWPDAFWKIPDEKWWDGYAAHETVVLDDFKGSSMRLTDFQRLIDWYPLWVEIKGGAVPMLAKRYVITSNEAPEWWYPRADPHNTVLRRVKDFARRHGRELAFAEDGTFTTVHAE